jgi:DNA mismatch repair protein MLH1
VEVDWHSEKGCFSTFLRELAFFNAPETMPDCSPEDQSEDEETKAQEEAQVAQQKWQLRYVVFPAMMKYLNPPKALVDKKAIIHVASLENLYKVFERC